jgi:RNA polymerase sigma-70 factor (ECF subfamily)
MKQLLSETLENDGDYYFRVALKILGSREEAEDAVQDTFLAALKNKAAFESKSSVKTWLTSILKHKCIDRLRTHCSKRKYVVSDDFSDLFLEDGHWKPHLVPSNSWGSDPEGDTERRKILRFVNDCMSLLHAQQRLLLLLTEVEGISREEVCNQTSLSPTNVAVILFRARTALRKCVDKKIK